jgi:hypothetical protein
LHIRFSDDYGVTWTAEDIDLDGNPVVGFPAYPTGAGPGDAPGPVEPWLIVAPNGDLLLHSWKIEFSVNNAGTWQSRSVDNGKTWGAWAQIDFLGTADDNNIFATDQDFVFGGVIYIGGRTMQDVTMDPEKVCLFTSADNGVSWTKVTDITTYALNTPEIGIEYIGDNTILAIIRDWNSRDTYQCLSTDLGATWGTVQTITGKFSYTGKPAGRIRVYTRNHIKGLANWWTDTVLIAVGFEFSIPGIMENRRNAIWISRNQGYSWEGPYFLDDQIDDAGYADILYNPNTDQYVIISYQGTQLAADLIQYNVSITGI